MNFQAHRRLKLKMNLVDLLKEQNNLAAKNEPRRTSKATTGQHVDSKEMKKQMDLLRQVKNPSSPISIQEQRKETSSEGSSKKFQSDKLGHQDEAKQGDLSKVYDDEEESYYDEEAESVYYSQSGSQSSAKKQSERRKKETKGDPLLIKENDSVKAPNSQDESEYCSEYDEEEESEQEQKEDAKDQAIKKSSKQKDNESGADDAHALSPHIVVKDADLNVAVDISTDHELDGLAEAMLQMTSSEEFEAAMKQATGLNIQENFYQSRATKAPVHIIAQKEVTEEIYEKKRPEILRKKGAGMPGSYQEVDVRQLAESSPTAQRNKQLLLEARLIDEEQILFEDQRSELKKRIEDRQYEDVFKQLVCQQEMLIEKRVRSSEKIMGKLNYAAFKQSLKKADDDRLINFELASQTYSQLSEESRMKVDRATQNLYRINPDQREDKRMQILQDLRRSKGFKVNYENKKKKFDDTKEQEVVLARSSAGHNSSSIDSKRRSSSSNVDFKRASVIQEVQQKDGSVSRVIVQQIAIPKSLKCIAYGNFENVTPTNDQMKRQSHRVEVEPSSSFDAKDREELRSPFLEAHSQIKELLKQQEASKKAVEHERLKTIQSLGTDLPDSGIVTPIPLKESNLPVSLDGQIELTDSKIGSLEHVNEDDLGHGLQTAQVGMRLSRKQMSFSPACNDHNPEGLSVENPIDLIRSRQVSEREENTFQLLKKRLDSIKSTEGKGQMLEFSSGKKQQENARQIVCEGDEVTATFGDSVIESRKRSEVATPQDLKEISSKQSNATSVDTSRKKTAPLQPLIPYTYDNLTIGDQLDQLQIVSNDTSPSPQRPPQDSDTKDESKDSAIKITVVPTDINESSRPVSTTKDATVNQNSMSTMEGSVPASQKRSMPRPEQEYFVGVTSMSERPSTGKLQTRNGQESAKSRATTTNSEDLQTQEKLVERERLKIQMIEDYEVAKMQAGKDAMLELQRKVSVLNAIDTHFDLPSPDSQKTKSRLQSKIHGHKIFLGAAKGRTIVKTADGIRITSQQKYKRKGDAYFLLRGDLSTMRKKHAMLADIKPARAQRECSEGNKNSSTTTINANSQLYSTIDMYLGERSKVGRNQVISRPRTQQDHSNNNGLGHYMRAVKGARPSLNKVLNDFEAHERYVNKIFAGRASEADLYNADLKSMMTSQRQSTSNLRAKTVTTPNKKSASRTKRGSSERNFTQQNSPDKTHLINAEHPYLSAQGRDPRMMNNSQTAALIPIYHNHPAKLGRNLIDEKAVVKNVQILKYGSARGSVQPSQLSRRKILGWTGVLKELERQPEKLLELVPSPTEAPMKNVEFAAGKMERAQSSMLPRRPPAAGRANLLHYEKHLKNIMNIGPGSYNRHFEKTLEVQDTNEQVESPLKPPLLAMSESALLPKQRIIMGPARRKAIIEEKKRRASSTSMNRIKPHVFRSEKMQVAELIPALLGSQSSKNILQEKQREGSKESATSSRKSDKHRPKSSLTTQQVSTIAKKALSKAKQMIDTTPGPGGSIQSTLSRNFVMKRVLTKQDELNGKARRTLMMMNDPAYSRICKVKEAKELAALRERQLAAARNKKAVTFNLDKSTSSKKTDLSQMAGRAAEKIDPAMISSSSSEAEIATPDLLEKYCAGNLYIKMKQEQDTRKRAQLMSSQDKLLGNSASASIQKTRTMKRRETIDGLLYAYEKELAQDQEEVERKAMRSQLKQRWRDEEAKKIQ